jgi:hypothetical protein
MAALATALAALAGFLLLWALAAVAEPLPKMLYKVAMGSIGAVNHLTGVHP